MLNSDMHVIILDIDGTIKDLVKENTEALVHTMKVMDRVDLKTRGKFVLWINKINMYFIKTGLLPTNSFMQTLLLLIYSVLLLKEYSKFKDIYFKMYNGEHIFFRGIDDKLREIHSNGNTLYLVTKNAQNQSVLNCLNENVISKLIIIQRKKSKYHMYNHIMDELKLSKDSITIIGDNLWDDVIPALALGVNIVWCNMYCCRLKRLAINLFSAVSKNIHKSDDALI